MELPKQKTTLGLVPGALLTQFSSSMIYITVFNTVMIVVTAWSTTLVDILPVSFTVFFSIGLVGWLLIMFLDYLFIQPSRMAYMNKQGWKHQNQVKISIEEFRKEFREEMAEMKREMLEEIANIAKEKRE